MEDEKPPRDPKDDAVVASLARERIHTLFDRKGDAFSSRKKVSHWVGANAWSDIADPDELLEGQPVSSDISSSSTSDDLGVQTGEGTVQEGGGVDEEVELADMFGDHGIVSPRATGRDGGGSFEIEYKGSGTNLWKGSEGEAGAVGQRTRASSLTEGEGMGMGMEEGVGGDDASRLERSAIEAEETTTDSGDPEKGGHEKGDTTSQPEADYLESEEPAQLRVNWALPRPQRRRKSLRPQQPTPPPPTPPPVAQKNKSVEPKSPGRPKANGAKSSSTRVRAPKVRVNGARAKAAAVKPPAADDGTPAAPVAPAKRGRGRPRLARAPQAVTSRDSDDG